jgi:hypothetical protein
MKTKMNFLVFFLAIAVMAVITSCEKEKEVAKPVISGLELGIGNSHLAYIGSDVHIQAEIEAEGLINLVTVEIHAEDGSGNEIEAEFDYSAQTLKNTTFHKHVDIPGEFPAGDYHFHLTVTDKEGNSTSVEEELTLEELVDEEAPVLTITSAPTSGQSFANGETISISGSLSDNEALAGMLVALVYEDDNITDADVKGNNSKIIIMLHTHTFDSETSHNFTASITVGAANDNNMTPAPIQGDNAWKSGNYYILVRSKDAMSNWVFSDHYPVVLNL